MENLIKSIFISRVNHRILLSTKFTFFIPNNLIYKNIIYTMFCQEHTNYIKRSTPPQKLECEIHKTAIPNTVPKIGNFNSLFSLQSQGRVPTEY